MQLKRQQLFDGIYLNCIPTDKFKAGLIQIRFLMPLTKETAAKNALVFPVILRGTEKYPSVLALRKRYDQLYASSVWSNVWKYGDSQVVALNSSPLSQKYAIDDTDITSGIIDIMEDAILHPCTENGIFTEEYVESEKKRLIEKLRADVNNKGRYATKRCVEVMFEGDPYGIDECGSINDIEKVCSKCLFEQYKKLISTARIEIFAVGEFDEALLRDRFSAIFSKVGRGEVYVPETKPLSPKVDSVKTVYDHDSVSQGKLVLGFRTGCDRSAEDSHIYEVFNEIFGGSATSKLFMNVREKLSLCYFCSSRQLLEKGAMLISSGIEFANEKKAVDEITVQLEKMKSGDFTDGEIEDAKKGIRDGILRTEDSTSNMAGWYFGRLIRGAELLSIEESIARVESVTREQIVEKARNVTLDTYYFLCGKEETK